MLMNMVDLIKHFGGVRPFAAKIGVGPTTVMYWKAAGRCTSPTKIFEVAEYARRNGVQVTPEELSRSAP